MKNLAVAIDLGATNIRVALLSKEGEILEKKSQKTEKSKSGELVTQQMVEMLSPLVEKNRARITGIGIGTIGPLDYKKMGVKNSPNVHSEFIPLNPIGDYFHLPIYLLNDCNAGVLGERVFGAGKEFRNLVYITISTGIGGGAIVDDHLIFGRAGNAAEIGHFTVDTKYNLLCSCKKGRGHWEGYASGENIPNFFKIWQEMEIGRVDYKFSSVKEIFAEARKGEGIVLKFVDELSRINARGISNAIVAYDPELITIGGSVALNNDDFILTEKTKKYIDNYLSLPEIKITPLGENIILLGAAAAAFHQEFIPYLRDIPTAMKTK